MPAQVTERQYQGQVHAVSRQLMSAWMEELGRAEAEGVPTGALMISGNCVELLRACHVLPMFPEVTALQAAIRKKSLPLILKAEQAGYSSDNCAYVKADIGLFLDGGMGPGKPIPFPTITVCNYVGCNVYVKWFEHLADISGSKLFMLDVPFARTAEPTEQDIRYVTAQLTELIALCESVSGKKFDIDELREILAHAARAEEGYARAKELCKNHPAPFDAYFDAINMMGPINVLRGTREAADFFDTAVKEFEGLVAQGLGPLSEERFRTVVEGPPPYPFYKSFRNLFSKWGAVGVASTYSTVGGIWEFGFRHDPRRPLESIAEQMLRENLTNRSIVARYAQIKRYVEEWKADALVIHSIKSCRLFS
ncbi:MAG TPA: benzoyl-CoA reductase subunit B, partial [Candidatus Rokubacteria bacterium]|nr:benzoyl-CoA reductase subunit B [Candidatus Rokubacteria bacterium]